MLDLKQINKSWTLFLDRDGVINHEKYQDYIYNYDEFMFYDEVPHALKMLADHFGSIILITNQKGVGKGLMTEEDLRLIHSKMVRDIRAAGGRIDKIYYCTSIDSNHPDRKPNPGMIFHAEADFPGIDLKKALIVGNNLSDMECGRNAGIYTVFVKTTHPEQAFPHPSIDLAYDDLPDFAKALQSL